MSRLLMNLRHVPDDEADEVRALLKEHGIGFYETQAGRWRISLAGIWVEEPDYPAARTLHELVLGRALTPAGRARLTEWLLGDRVGDALLRAGLPKSWKIADKTGAGSNGARGIVAVAWPEGRGPLTIAIYIAETKASLADRNAAIAEIGAAIARSVG